MYSDNMEEISLPDIYFDEPEESPEIIPPPENILYTAGEVLAALEKLLFFVHNGRELRFLQLRMQGFSFREISRETHCSHGAVVRFFLRVKKTAPEVSRFLEHTPFLSGKNEKYLTKDPI